MGVWMRSSAPTSLSGLYGVEGGTHDRIGVDAEMPIEILDVPGLAEIADAQ